MSKEIKSVINMMPAHKKQCLFTMAKIIKNFNGEFVVKDYLLEGYCGVNEFTTTKEDMLSTLEVIGEDKYSFVDIAIFDDILILNVMWAKNYGHRIEEIKGSLCRYMCNCDIEEICTSFCNKVCHNLKKFNTTEDKVMNMSDKEFKELKDEVKEYYSEEEEYSCDGPFGGAFRDEADYWRYREGYNSRY